MSEKVDRGGTHSVGFAWLSLLFAAWITAGLAVVNWAVYRGLVQDIGFSPYHVPAYLGLLCLTVTTVVLIANAVGHGRPWRTAFPPGYGVLGLGLLVGLAYPVADVAWRDGVGIAVDSGAAIENTLAPSRVLIPIGIILIAVGPLRAAARSPGTGGRWAAVLSAGFVLALLGNPGGFQPAANPRLERPPVAIQGNEEVWAMDADGTRQTRLIEADESSAAGLPSWSPDQTRFAYTRWEVDAGALDGDVWVANADGTERRELVGGEGWQWFPHWSPDGAWIVYTQEAEGGPFMATGPIGPGVGPGLQGPEFAVPGAPRSHAAIWRVPSDGSAPPQRVTDGTADDRAAAYSPDGTRLVLDSLRDGNTEIYVTDVDGGNARRLTDDPGEDWGASWSPDGTRIAFHSSRLGDWRVFVMGADGSGLTRLAKEDIVGREPAWSPDGSRIAFETWISGKQAIWSMAADGTDPQDLSRDPGAATLLGGADGTWGRDGRIVYSRNADLPASSQSIARQDLAAAAMLLEAILVAIVALVLVRLDPPFGAFAVVMGMATLLAAIPTEQWRFVPAAFAAGLVVDVLVRFAPPGRKASVACAASAAAFVLGSGAAVAATTGLGWTSTLLLGVAFAGAALGWGLGAVVGQPIPRTEERTGP